MAKNTGEGHRDGAVKDRTQTYNPKTDSWIKRDSETGRFLDNKTTNNKPFKGVTKEKLNLRNASPLKKRPSIHQVP